HGSREVGHEHNRRLPKGDYEMARSRKSKGYDVRMIQDFLEHVRLDAKFHYLVADVGIKKFSRPEEDQGLNPPSLYEDDKETDSFDELDDEDYFDDAGLLRLEALREKYHQNGLVAQEAPSVPKDMALPQEQKHEAIANFWRARRTTTLRLIRLIEELNLLLE